MVKRSPSVVAETAFLRNSGRKLMKDDRMCDSFEKKNYLLFPHIVLWICKRLFSFERAYWDSHVIFQFQQYSHDYFH
jgi:hypothetical protein